MLQNLVSPHNQFEEFVKLFTDIVNFHAPRRRATRKEKKLKSKPWLTQGLLKSIKLKNKMYKQFLMHPNNYQFDKYKKYRNVLNRAIEGAKRNYYNKIVTEEKHNSEKLYQTINKICKLKNSKRIFPTKLLNDKGNVTTKPEEIACVLNEHFASVGYKMAQDIPAPPSHIKMTKPNSCNFNSIFLSPSTNAEVCSIIDRLKNKKAQRYTDVETKFIKYGKLIISPIISNLFNLCIETGVFPNCLKIAEVIPIYKKGDQNMPTNYRPISLLSQFDKIFEKMLFSRLFSYLNKNQLLNKNQFGFRPNSSTQFAISTIHDKLIKNIDNGLYTCCIFLDLSKAFDTVNHTILLWKLYHYFGIRGTALHLIESYLSNRYQYTNVQGHYSNKLKIITGVPQGSCLGPLLFLLYINDLPLASEFDTTLYADDTALMISDRDLNSLKYKANNELKKVDFWLRMNKLSLNYSKTNYIIYNNQPHKTCKDEFTIVMNKTRLQRENSIKYLGVIFDDTLCWANHIDNLSSQLARYSGLFCRLRNYVPRKTLFLLYYNLVYSRIQYGILTWGTATKLLTKKIEVRLNRIIRIATFSSIYTPINTMYKQLNILKISDIYHLELGKFMYQLYSDRLPAVFAQLFKKIKEIHSHNTRQTEKSTYFLPRVYKTIGQQLLTFRGVKLWYLIDDTTKDRHWVSFKKAYKQHLIDQY